ncbi:MAG: 3-hydroxyacyl-CoA dehydrogenase family protein, partial [Pseudomonadota bacterium]
MAEQKNIAVLGAGLMGHGIALTFASAGHSVRVFDPQDSARDSLHERVRDSMQQLGKNQQLTTRTLTCIEPTDQVSTAVSNADIVIEAAPEKLPLKQSLFAECETHAPPTAIIASNTSVIQISKIVGNLNSKHRMLGTHWWNPPHQIPLVEVIKTQWTDAALANTMQTLLNSVGKQAVMVEKDVPGFIGNRLQHALWREAVSLVENGICTADAVDNVVKSSFGRRLAVLGPLEN